MSEDGYRPVPVPRPRQSKSTDETDTTSKVYENFKIQLPPNKNESVYDNLNLRLDELKLECDKIQVLPVPTPRTRGINREKQEKIPELPKKLNNNQPEQPKTTGAIRKVPNIPQVRNNFDDPETIAEKSPDTSQKDFDVLSQSSSTSGKSNSEKFITPSPSQILKTIGSSSKMLRESIGERIGEKTSSAKHKLLKEFKSSKHFIGSWTNDTKSSTTKKLKNVRSKIDNFSLKRNKNQSSYEIGGNDADDRPQTMPPDTNDKLFQSLTFNSPLNSRTQNSENIPSMEVSNYEIPKSINRRSIGDLPTYDDAMSECQLERNTNLTQSMYSMVQKPNNLNKNKSLSTISDSDSSGDDRAPPNIPVPELPEKAIYGKIRQLPTSDYENAPMIPLRNPPPIPTKIRLNESPIDLSSDGATICGDDDRSESWQFHADTISHDSTIESIESNEPIYSNDENERIVNNDHADPLHLLEPLKLLNTQNVAKRTSYKKTTSVTRDILDEFDPLSRESFDAFIMNNMNHLSLLETLLSEDTYGTSTDYTVSADIDDSTPTPPERFDSLQNIAAASRAAPEPPQRTKARQTSVIIHQNLRLRDDDIEPYLAKVDEPSTSSDTGIVDLSRPKTSKSSWFDSNNDDAGAYLPTYEESKNDEIVSEPQSSASQTPAATPVTKSKSSIFNFNLKRKSSFKEVKVNYIPRAPFSDDSSPANDKSVILFKLPSGVIEDILKELNPRFVELKRRQFRAYSDPEFKVLKEHLDLTHLTSIQFLNQNHKFSDFKTDSGRQIFCFEINLANPKTTGKTQKVTYIYGIHSKQEKCLWMQKILRGMTTVFPKEFTSDYVRAGWCYMKKSVTSAWTGTWLLLSRRKLLFYDFNESRLETLDLRKARCIGLKDDDDGHDELLIDKDESSNSRKIMLIDCPPYTCCYFVMNSMRETKIWSLIVSDDAHANGQQLRHQQLTKDNVPVFLDKCINFVYTNGTMSEGIYRKAGSSSNIQKLTIALKKDAFSVQITRSEYNEHDVSSALKRFFRELPQPLMGKLAVSFLCVSQMNDNSDDKMDAYRELLRQLPIVEYQTLKKLLGHLHFIQTQKSINKMGAENLGMIFGPTLMQPSSSSSEQNHYQMDHREQDVIAELILNFKKLYEHELSEDEIKKEQIMLQVLQKYHSAAENLSDIVKQSGDFKVWIAINEYPDAPPKPEDDKKLMNVSLTPSKTSFELCEELESQFKGRFKAHELQLVEVVLNGQLHRALHYNEKVLNTVLRWSSWHDADDRKSNYLEMRPQTKFYQQIVRAIHTLPSLTPNMPNMKFADRKSKMSAKQNYTLELTADTATINIYKTPSASDKQQQLIKISDIQIPNTIVYLGAEKKRDIQMRWALTFVELNFKKRSRDSPFIGHVIAGNNINDQITWYTSILYSLYENDVMPNPQLVIP